MNIKKCPCGDCSERFLACSGNCPKDARGEYGYNAWTAERKAEKAALESLRYPTSDSFMQARKKSYRRCHAYTNRHLSG